MAELVTKLSDIMDEYDSSKRVALLVEEWGIWTEVEPGTNPGCLYQQNSLRDALIAGTTLNIFNNHSDRVCGANLAPFSGAKKQGNDWVVELPAKSVVMLELK